MASRTTIQLQLDDEVASLLHARAAEANVSEHEIVGRALRAFDLRATALDGRLELVTSPKLLSEVASVLTRHGATSASTKRTDS